MSEQGHPASMQSQAPSCDVLVIGGGIGGLTVALSLPPEVSVVLLTKAALGESNTRYAQGGLAAAVGRDDSPALHLRDTLDAGAGLVDEHAASILVNEADAGVRWLIAEGTRFDELPAANDNTSTHAFDLTREAAHSRHRVLHARDATGAEVERALVAAMRARPHAQVWEGATALDLVVRNGACTGADMLLDGVPQRVLASRGVVLANGGAGQLWLRTSNPPGATGDGMMMAWRAGAALADLEFAQFHPTVLVPPDGGEPFLISEAVRGEGAWLRNAAGERFMPRYSPDAELAPRDVVARAILSEMLATGATSASLDLRHMPDAEVHARFPTIAAICARYGLDLAHDLIPVAPAAHYFMGGVVVDAWARTTLPGLYAVGEVACTGVHGANRLASNSLLEGLVFGRRAARAIAENPTSAADWPVAPALPGTVVESADLTRTLPPIAHGGSTDGPDPRAVVRQVMWEHVSVRRDAAGLERAEDVLTGLADRGTSDTEARNMIQLARFITRAALARCESRGGHYRVDYPGRDVRQDGEHSLFVPAVPLATAFEDRGHAWQAVSYGA